MSPQTSQVSEIVTFHLNEGVAPDDYLAITRRSGEWAKTHPGFVSRHVSRGADGSWTDVTVWDSAENAKASQASFMEQDFAPEMIGMIAKDSFSMIHRDVLWQQE